MSLSKWQTESDTRIANVFVSVRPCTAVARATIILSLKIGFRYR
jgi:hypothetical protein